MAHHNHAHHQHRRERVGNVRRQETVFNVVYVTAAPTFTGIIAGYKTMDGSEEVNQQLQPAPETPSPTPETPSPTPESSPTVLAQSSQPKEQVSTPLTTPVAVPQITQEPVTAPTQQPAKASKATSEAVTSEAATSEAPSSASRSATKKPDESTSKTLSETLVPTKHVESSTPSLEATSAVSSISAQPAASSSSTASPVASNSSGGMSGGAKAGLAIGILLAIGALAGLIFFCIRRRRNHRNEAYSKSIDEKAALGNEGVGAGLARSASVQTSGTSRTAPRLSLRPVTQFLPDLAAQRRSGGNLLAVAGGPARHNPPTSHGVDVEKAAAGKQTNDPANPFGNHAELSEKVPVQNNTNDPANPFGNHAETSRQLTNASPEPEVVPPAPLRIRTPTPDGSNAAGAEAAVASAAGANSAPRQDAPKPLNLSPNRAPSPALGGHPDGALPSPAGTEFSMTPASPGSLANGQPPSNVHRIQLDFKPSMDDELSLRAGQLVRLLHEYDDGWALCIRLDRSQQGVAPRTCLSARPVKPRPPPGARGPPPPGMFPNQPRPSSSASGRGSPSPYDRAPRANSPSPARGQRSMSPGPYGGGPQRPTIPTPGKRRSNSASAVRERRNSPPGPSPMNPNVQRVPMQLQAVTTPAQVIAQSPPASVARKPVPGQAT